MAREDLPKCYTYADLEKNADKTYEKFCKLKGRKVKRWGGVKDTGMVSTGKRSTYEELYSTKGD